MLGNFSFGDYFKAEAIAWAWELVTGVWALPADRLWFTVYTDDDERRGCGTRSAPAPTGSCAFGEKDNFWSMGETGPCGPCSEIHFYLGDDPAGNRPELVNGPGDDTVEIWNLVFMQYDRTASGRSTRCAAVRRHRRRTRAAHRRTPGRAQQLRHRPVRAGHRPHRRARPAALRAGRRARPAFRVIATTPAPARSCSPTASYRPTRDAATCSGGSSGGPCATAASLGFDGCSSPTLCRR